MGKNLRIVCALVKSFYLKTGRNKYFLYLQLSMPCFVILVIVFLRILAGSSRRIERIDFKPFNPTSLEHIRGNYNRIALLPKSNEYVKIIEPIMSARFQRKFQFSTNIPKANHLNPIHFLPINKRFLCFIEVFSDDDNKGNRGINIRFPPNLRSINADTGNISHWQTYYVTKMLEEYDVTSPLVDDYTTLPGYYLEGFLGVLDMFWDCEFHYKRGLRKIDYSDYFRNSSTGGDLINLTMHGFPRLQGKFDIFYYYLNSYFPMFIMFILMMSSLIAVREATLLNRTYIRYMYQMMGVSTRCYLVAWYIYSIPVILFFGLMAIFACKISTPYSDPVFPNSEYYFLILFFTLYSLSMISMIFGIITLLSNSKFAVELAGLYYIITLIPFNMSVMNYKTSYLQDHIICLLFPNTAMGFGISIIFFLERYNEGISFYNILTTAPEIGVSEAYILLCFVIQSVIFTLTSHYLEQKNLTDYGTNRKWNYLFTQNKTNKKKIKTINNVQSFENVTDKKIMFQIRNLYKKFDRKYELHDINIDIYKHGVTSILGENGCGKTIFLFIITGILQATSGKIYVNRTDLSAGYKKLDVSFGYCPQKSILSFHLTVYEELYLGCRLRGFSESDTKNELNEYINMFKLSEVKNVLLQVCPDGVRKKVQIILAFIDNPDIIILDDPFANLDIVSKKVLFDLIMEKKKTSTIIMVSYAIDEMELLSDRILLMKDGTFIAGGTANYLRQLYGIDHTIKILTKHDEVDVSEISKLIQYIIRDSIQPRVHIGCHLQYIIRKTDVDDDKLVKKVEESLKRHQNRLDIESFVVQDTALDEAFHRATYKADAEERPVIVPMEQFRRYRGSDLQWNQIEALFLKQIYYAKYLFIPIMAKLFLPCLLIYCGLMQYVHSPGVLPPVLLEAAFYIEPMVLIGCDSSSTAKHRYNALKLYSERFETIHEIFEIANKSAIDSYIEMINENPMLEGFILFGVDFKEDGDTIFFNTKMFHASAVALNTYYLAIFSAVFQEEVTIQNWPLPTETKEYLFSKYEGASFFDISSTMISLGLSLWGGLVVLVYSLERSSDFYHLQIACEVNSTWYWLVNMIWDYVFYILSVTLMVFVTLFFHYSYFGEYEFIGTVSQLDFVRSNINLGAKIDFTFTFSVNLYIVMFIFGIPFLVQIYISSLEGGESLEVIYTIMHSIFTSAIVAILDQISRSPTESESKSVNFFIDVYEILRDYEIISFFSIWYNLYSIMLVLHWSSLKKLFCTHKLGYCLGMTAYKPYRYLQEAYCYMTLRAEFSFCDKEIFSPRYFSYSHGVGKSCSLFLYSTLFSIGIRIFLSNISCTKCFRRKHEFRDPNSEELEVAEEKKKIRNYRLVELKRPALILKNVTKYFGAKRIVNGICVEVRKGEALGLTGSDGAGTSTIFRMITHQTSITLGIVCISGYNLFQEYHYACLKAAITPDVKAFNVPLTVGQIVMIISMMRGYSYDDSKLIVRELALGFHYEEYLKFAAKTTSSGILKSISNSLVSIGNCPVLLYDNPTISLDLRKKLRTWSAIDYYKTHGRCIVFISQNLKGLDILSDRVGVMAIGNLMSLGPLKEMKIKYASGFQLFIEYKSEATKLEIRKIEIYIIRNFIGAISKSSREENSLRYYVATSTLSREEQGRLMERGRRELAIMKYEIHKANLTSFFTHCSEII